MNPDGIKIPRVEDDQGEGVRDPIDPRENEKEIKQRHDDLVRTLIKHDIPITDKFIPQKKF